MKNYAILITNVDTGEVEHCATHIEPIPAEYVPSIDSGNYIVESYEFDSVDENVPFVKAREVLNRVNKSGSTAIEKMNSIAKLKIPEDTLIKNFIKV